MASPLFMAKIALGIICKDDTEAEDLDKALATVAPHVDGIFITGTHKPQQRIKKICKKYKANLSYFEWQKDFAKARNFNFKQIPKDYDWIFWMDCDDRVVGAETFRDAIKKADEVNCKSIFARYLYQVELDEQGRIRNILIEHLRERLIKNDDSHEWVGAVHETLIERYPTGKTDYQGFYVVHLSKTDNLITSMYRNIDILEDEVANKPHDPRPIYYLAKAYFDTSIPEIVYEPAGEGLDSITVELLKDYIRKSGWKEERSQCWEYLSMIHRERKEFKKAVYCLLEALNEYPLFPSTYIQLGLNYVLLKEWNIATHWIKLAGQVEIPKTTLVVNPKDYKAMILECLYHIYLNTQKLEETENVVKALVDINQDDLNKQRLKDIIDLRHRNNLAHWIVKTAHHLKNTNQLNQLRALVNAIPSEIAHEPVMVSLKQEMTPPREWNKDEIAIFCGPGWEKWSPKNASKGIGGSEEAVIYLSKELAKKGWKVTVYADPQDDAGDYDGVKYLPHYDFNWNDYFNVFVSWRQLGVFDQNIRAKKTYLWLHDIANALEYTPERVNKIDKVMFLSKWHRGNVPNLPEDKVMYTSNGINI